MTFLALVNVLAPFLEGALISVLMFLVIGQGHDDDDDDFWGDGDGFSEEAIAQ